MKVIIHAGTHKTGTTSIQHALRRNRDLLEESGVHYPLFAPCTSTHHRFAHGLTGADPDALRQAEGFARAALDRAGPMARVLVISAEPIYRHINGLNGWDDYGEAPDYWPRRVAYLQRLAGLFEGHETEVLLVFRDRAAFARSLRHELAKKQIWTGTEADFLRVFYALLDYERQLEAFRATFPVVTVLSYEACMEEDGSVLSAFFRAIGTTLPPRAQGIWENASG